MSRACTLDIETDWYLNRWTYQGDGPRILCAVAIDIDTEEVHHMTSTFMFRHIMSQFDTIILHNGVEYDLPVLNELWGIDYEIAKHVRGGEIGLDTLLGNNISIIDTIILSRMVYPERRLHGLESYTEEFDIPKPEVDFAEDSISSVLHRCESDCWITLSLYKKIISAVSESPIDDAYAREKHVADINQRREAKGVGFNKAKALEHCDTLDELMKPLADSVLPHLPAMAPLPKSKVKMPPKEYFLKKTGQPTKNTIKYFGDMLYLDEETYVWCLHRPLDSPYGPLVVRLKDHPHDQPLVTHRPITMKDTDIIKDWLIGNGWKPLFYNKDKDGEKTTPKVRDNGNLCPNLEAMSYTMPEIKDYVLYNTYQHRRNTLKSSVNDVKGWCNNVRLEYDGRLTPGANTLGAVTRRFTHREVANVPRVGSVFGSEMRELFLP